MQKIFAAALLAALVTACGTPGPTAPADSGSSSDELLSWEDIQDLPEPLPLPPLQYGSDPQQFGELRVPPGVDGPFPVLILIHGDCWSGDEGMAYMRPLANALANLGVATWNIEYRRPATGADWTNAYSDVALATDFLRTLAPAHSLNLKRVVSSGHAMGGQLAMWLATRPKLGKTDALHQSKPLPVQGVIGLAAVTRLSAKVGESTCPSVPADAKVPALRFPLGVPQWFVHGAQDPLTPSDVVLKYAEAARKKGDKVTLGITTNAGHFEPVAPASATWTALQQAVIASLLQ